MNRIVNFALTGVISLLAVSAIAAESDMNTTVSPPSPADTNVGVDRSVGPQRPAAGSANNPSDRAGTGMTGTSKSYPDFDTIDNNKNGEISLGEYKKQGGTQSMFRNLDKNNDNKLDKSELIQ